MFTISFKTDNAQFGEMGLEAAIKQILREGANMDSRLNQNTLCDGRVYDINGNTIGRWSFVPDGVENAR